MPLPVPIDRAAAACTRLARRTALPDCARRAQTRELAAATVRNFRQSTRGAAQTLSRAPRVGRFTGRRRLLGRQRLVLGGGREDDTRSSTTRAT